MSGGGPAKKYDMIFVGTSMICVLEAVYQSLCGKSVLMIDRQKDMGGAWLSLDIFGLHDVENAIHYFLPDPYAFDFMKEVLTWDVIPSERKYQVFLLPLGRSWSLPYDHGLARFLGKVTREAFERKRALIPNLLRATKEVLFTKRQPSYYVRGGVPEMLSKVKTILLASAVEVRYSASIEGIHIDHESETVRVTLGEETLLSKTIVFSHGSRISNLTSSAGAFPIEEQVHRRPALHLLVRDESPSRMYECIFTADRLIKYVHDVTRVTREAAELVGKKKVFVLALHDHVQPTGEVYQEIFAKLMRVGMVGTQAVLEDQYWQEVFLPRLGDADLERLKGEFGPQVEFLKTENFSVGIGYHAHKWAGKIRFPGEAMPGEAMEEVRDRASNE